MMNDQQKLEFIHKMSKMALQHLSAPQHFDAGGVALPQATTSSSNTITPAVQGLANPFNIGGAAGSGLNAVSGVAGAGLNSAVNGVGGVIQGLGSALTHQNGYQANLAPTTQIDYAAPAGQAIGNIGQGYNQSQALLGQQQGLANTLADQAAGNGPNIAQATLNQATGQNIAQQAALAAGTRGAGANAGLIASNAARQGAATQQQAVGQGATMRAQQQLAAQQQLQAQQAALQSNIQGEQGIQGNLYGANVNANNAQNNSSISNYGMAQGINAQAAQGNADAVNKTTGGILKGIGSALGGLFAEGGMVHPHLHKMAKVYYPHLYAGGGEVNFGVSSMAPPAVSTPARPAAAPEDSDGGDSPLAGLAGSAIGGMMKSGGKVPGTPKVNHDAYENDTVDAKLSPGEVVIDLNTLKDKGKLGQMARFVAANIERKKMGRKP